MAWKRRDPNNPLAGDIWVPDTDPDAMPGTGGVPLTGDEHERYPNDPAYFPSETPPTYQTSEPPPTPPTAPTDSRWDAGLKAQMDAIGAQYGRTWRPDEYDQWIGPNGYIMRDDINGSGQVLRAWSGGEIDPYWQYRMGLHATGDYWGNGTTPSDANSSRALSSSGPVDQGAVDYGPFQPPQYSVEALSQNDPFAAMGGGVWIPSLGQWVPKDHPLANTPGAQPGGQPPAAAGSPAVDMESLARQRIIDLLNTPRTVDPNTLRDSPEMQAVYLMAQRAEERDRAALAERAAAGGWSGSGGMEGGINALREQRGATEMQMMGQLATQYMERQREDLKAGIEYALNQGQFEDAQALQRELAALEAAIQREKIAADVSMNNAEIALREKLGIGDLDLRRELGLGELDLRRYLGDIDTDFNYAQLKYAGKRDDADRAARIANGG